MRQMIFDTLRQKPAELPVFRGARFRSLSFGNFTLAASTAGHMSCAGEHCQKLTHIPQTRRWSAGLGRDSGVPQNRIVNSNIGKIVTSSQRVARTNSMFTKPSSIDCFWILDGWWPGTESNRRHADFQSAALPTELPGPRSLERLSQWANFP